MLLGNPDVAASPQRELKVKIPAHLHLQLHALKILRGASISDTVAAAITEYLDRHPQPGA